MIHTLQLIPFKAYLIVAVQMTAICAHSFQFSEKAHSQACLSVGSKLDQIDNFVTQVAGADTGLFYRETLKVPFIVGARSCVYIPNSPNQKNLLSLYKANPKTQKPDQAPYFYLGVNIGFSHREAGLYYESYSPKGISPGFRIFTAGFDGAKIRYYRKQTFKPGDKVCLQILWDIEKQSLTFDSSRISVPDNTQESVHSIREQIFASGATQAKFKRVSGMALRSLNSVSLGKNGDMSQKRLKALIHSKVYQNVVWTDLEAIQLGGKIQKLTAEDIDFDDNQNSSCQKTTIWPSSAFKITPINDNGAQMVEILPQNRALYASFADPVLLDTLAKSDSSQAVQSLLDLSEGAAQSSSAKRMNDNSTKSSQQGSAVQESNVSANQSDFVSFPEIQAQQPVVSSQELRESGERVTETYYLDHRQKVAKCCSGRTCKVYLEPQPNIWKRVLPEAFYNKFCVRYIKGRLAPTEGPLDVSLDKGAVLSLLSERSGQNPEIFKEQKCCWGSSCRYYRESKRDIWRMILPPQIFNRICLKFYPGEILNHDQ